MKTVLAAISMSRVGNSFFSGDIGDKWQYYLRQGNSHSPLNCKFIEWYNVITVSGVYVMESATLKCAYIS